MTKNPNVFSDFRVAETASTQLQPGDVALVLKKDGSVLALNFGYDSDRLLLPDSQMSDDDRMMRLQGQKLFALALAVQHPQIMDLLLNIASDPDVVDFEKLCAVMRVH